MNPLQDAIPAKYRKYAYAAAFVASLVFAAWQASGGDWETFGGGILAAVLSALAHGNTDVRRSVNTER